MVKKVDITKGDKMDMDVVRIAENHLRFIIEDMEVCETQEELQELKIPAEDALESYYNALKASLEK